MNLDIAIQSQRVLDRAERLFTSEQLDDAIRQMAEQLNSLVKGQPALVLCVMNGGVVLAGKLLPLLDFPLAFDALNASRYRGETTGADVQWNYASKEEPSGTPVILLDDILDKGVTLATVKRHYLQNGASQVVTAVLVDKILQQPKPLIADVIGVQADDRYLFGYGMDYKGYLRNAPGIYACAPEDC